jgi:outer membrane protein OmpA-like peptidoglycan-associated protein/tetratricopeptide (TPR) repeat protein
MGLNILREAIMLDHSMPGRITDRIVTGLRGKQVFCLICLSLLFGQLAAQSSKLRKADELFESFSYHEAIPLYEQLKDGPDGLYASLRLAECYRLTNRIDQAEGYYAMAVDQDNIHPLFLLYYAQALQSNGKCSEALDWYRRYAYLAPNDPRGVDLQIPCNDITDLVGGNPDYELLPVSFNTPGTEFAAFPYRNGVVFATARKPKKNSKTHGWTGEPYLKLYFAEGFKDSYGRPELFSSDLVGEFNDGPASFNGTGNTIYFSRNNKSVKKKDRTDDGGVALRIYKASFAGDGWGQIEELSFMKEGVNYTHPCVSADGQTLYFASDLEGGLGAMDIWRVSYDEEKQDWSEPENLGDLINTPGEEMFPFIHDDGSLFFASDGHRGLGGLDIFESKVRGGNFLAPQNLLAPINSTRDDFGLIFDPDREQGYFASNRPGGRGKDDIYSLTRFPLFVEGLLVAEGTMNPLADARIILMKGDDQVATARSDSEGRFALRVGPYESYTVTAYREGYNAEEVSLETGRYNPDRLIIPLEKLIPPEKALALSIKVIEKERKTPIEAAQLFLRNEDTGIIQNLETDENGEVSIVIDKSFRWTIAADKVRYFNIQEELNPAVTADLRQLTRVLELEPYVIGEAHIFKYVKYRHAQTELDLEAKLELDALARLMVSNPTMVVEIGSHTDANGSRSTNLRVSSGRAQAVVDYLIAQGVSEERLVAQGYGESQLLNHCSDGVICPQELHSENRRTEWKIISF